MRFHRSLAWLLLLPLLLLGCGKSGPKVVPVSGQVTLDKKPLANADVTFSPTEPGPNNSPGLESSGRTDEQGRYSLKVIQDKRDGAVVGAHKVRISLIERGASLVNRLPKAYNQNTKLTFTVPAEGSKEANFDLSSKGK
jgi:hypothetical protein